MEATSTKLNEVAKPAPLAWRCERCTTCHGSGVDGYTRFLDAWVEERCGTCLGEGRVLYAERERSA